MGVMTLSLLPYLCSLPASEALALPKCLHCGTTTRVLGLLHLDTSGFNPLLLSYVLARQQSMVRCLRLCSRARSQEVAEFACTCERYVGTQSGGMDQAISMMGMPGVAQLINFDPVRPSVGSNGVARSCWFRRAPPPIQGMSSGSIGMALQPSQDDDILTRSTGYFSSYPSRVRHLPTEAFGCSGVLFC